MTKIKFKTGRFNGKCLLILALRNKRLSNQPSNVFFTEKIELVQYNALLAITGVINGMLRVNLFQELGLEKLSFCPEDGCGVFVTTNNWLICPFPGFYPSFFFLFFFCQRQSFFTVSLIKYLH